MSWTGKSFRARHNHKLSTGQANKAASMANAMLKNGVDEGIAIATANKHVEASPPEFPQGNYTGPGRQGFGAKARTGKTRSYFGR